MSDFRYFPRDYCKAVYEYANVVPCGIDGIGAEHAVVQVPKYYKRDAGMTLCRIHLPKRENERILEDACSRQHYEIVALKERIAMLENYITGLGFAVAKEQT